MSHPGFDYLRAEGRKEVLAALEPYLEHTPDCLASTIDISQFKCYCGLGEILERIRNEATNASRG